MKNFRILEIPAVLFILFVVANRSFAIEDISFDDETSYLFRGLASTAGSWPSFTNGATYSDMYWLIGCFISDPVNVYFIGRALAAVILVACTWIATRLLVSRLLAWALTAIIALTPVIFVWPGVSGPATGLMLLGLALAWRYRSLASMGATTLLYWIAAGSRPELSWLALTMSAITVVATLKLVSVRRTENYPKARTAFIGLGGAILTPMVLIILHGSPFVNNNRDWLAFAQHYSLRHFAAGENPWVQAGSIVERSFPTATSITGAFFENPHAFASHILANIFYSPRGFVSNLVGERESILTSGLLSSLAIITLLLSATLVFLLNRRYSLELLRKPISRQEILKNWWFSLVLILTLTALAIPVILIYPRLHYLVLPALISVVGLGFFLDRCNHGTYINQGFFGLILILFLLWTFQGSLLTIQRVSQPPIMATSATEMSKSSVEWRMLGIEWGFEAYVPGLVKVKPERPLPKESVSEYLDRLDINSVLITPGLSTSEFSTIDGFEDFIKGPRNLDFLPIIDNSPILIRK